MSLIKLKERPQLAQNKRLASRYESFENLLKVLEERSISSSDLADINTQVQLLNEIPDEGSAFSKQLRKSQMNILKRVREQYKWVQKGYYQTLWLSLGMAAFGIPIGVAFSTALGNMAFLGIGLPIGLAIGIAVGAGMDRKAKDNGNQLDVDIRY